MDAKTLKGYILTISGGICWAVGGICGQLLFTRYGVTANWLVPYRLTLAGLVLLLYSALSGQKIFAVWQDRRNLKPLLLFALLGSAVCQYGYYSSIQYSNAALATVLCYTSPLFILLYTTVRNRALPKPYQALCALLVLAGAFICATHFQLGALVISPLALFWGLTSAAGFAFYTISPRRLMAECGVLCITGWGMLIAGFVLLAVLHPWTIGGVQYGWAFLGCLVMVILVGTVFSFGLYQLGCTIVGPLAGTVLSSVEPVGSVILSALLLHTAFTWEDILGFALILSTIPILAVFDAKGTK